MALTVVFLNSAPYNQISIDKAASGKRSKSLLIIVVALLQSIFNTVARRSCSHQYRPAPPPPHNPPVASYLTHSESQSL